ncbi:hypothetical protein OG890_06890 [Streptomyces anulatus]|uniref:hypothetical protein n=1 Tax=Streptomyces anulatus TaxID=1892 RepID=UPI00224DB4B3|nr:hypothetical protein [Streptomyces anulatus]MCX4483669.1 hypothetical protein [Streptomyces anulatus]
MRRTTVLPAALLAAALLALTACSAEEDKATPAPEPSAPAAKEQPADADSGESSDAEKSAGIPDAPTRADRSAYLAAIKAVDPGIVEDEEKAIDAGRNQCSHLATPNDSRIGLPRSGSATTPGRSRTRRARR